MNIDDERQYETHYRQALRALIRDEAVRVRAQREPGQWVRIEARRGGFGFVDDDEVFANDPTVLTYDRRRIAVRDDILEAFRDNFSPIDERLLDGFDDIWIAELAADDAYDVWLAYYKDEPPQPEPGREEVERNETTQVPGEPMPMDEVALLHRFWAASHVLFWPLVDRPTDYQDVPPPTDAGPPRTVVVIDTGVHKTHPYLPPVGHLRSEAKDDDIMRPTYDGHGTAVAGAVRRRNDHAEIVGARLNVNHSLAEEAELASLISAVPAPAGKTVVVNLSFGGPTVGQRPPLYVAIERFLRKGGRAVVAAAGNLRPNEHREPVYPAAWKIVHGVASKDENGQVHPWSNHGPWVDWGENGENVVTSVIRGNKNFAKWSGTSFAAPQRAATI